MDGIGAVEAVEWELNTSFGLPTSPEFLHAPATFLNNSLFDHHDTFLLYPVLRFVVRHVDGKIPLQREERNMVEFGLGVLDFVKVVMLRFFVHWNFMTGLEKPGELEDRVAAHIY